MNKTLWLIATARNAIIVIVTGFIGYHYISLGQNEVLKVIGDVPSGLPSFGLPPFSVPEIRDENGTVTQEYEGFFDMLSYLGSGIIVVPLIALLENMSICKAFGEPPFI